MKVISVVDYHLTQSWQVLSMWLKPGYNRPVQNLLGGQNWTKLHNETIIQVKSRAMHGDI